MSIKSILQNKPCNEEEKKVIEKLRREAKSEKHSSFQSEKHRNEVNQFLDLIKNKSKKEESYGKS